MNLTINVATTAVALPAGITGAGIRISITDTESQPVVDADHNAIAPVMLTSAPYSASFSNVPAGSFVAVATAVDTTGAAIGEPVSQPFTVPVAGPTYDAPASLTVTLQA